MRPRSSLLLIALPLLAAPTCERVIASANPDHCTLHEGDEYCAGLFPERPYCITGKDECAIADAYGCVAEPEPGCHAPCGALSDDACMGGETTGTGTGSSGSGSGSDSGSESSESTTGPMPCMDNGDCGGGTPFCEPVSGECVTCDGTEDPDGSCAGVDPANPVCLDGACVQCTAATPDACMGMTPVCDDATNSCVPCTAHDQCTGESACNLFTGACLPSDAVVHVGPGQTHGTLAEAVASFGPGAEGTIVVHQANYDEAVTVDGGRVLALLANAGDTPIWLLAGGGAPQLTVGDGTVLLDGLRLSGNADDVGLVVDGGRAWVDRGRIVQNTGGGIVAQGGAELRLRNCFVGGSVDDAHALEVNDATADVLYSTLGSGTFNASALSCTAPIAVDVRNSILVTRGGSPPDEIACATANITYSATEGAVAGDGNVAVGMFPGGSPGDWFVDYTTGNFHLQNDGLTLFANVAQWTTGDPSTDIDGQPRPTVDGTADFAGADTVP